MSRKVRICTISMNAAIHGTRSSKEDRFREAEAKIARGALDKPDLFLLPEHFLVNDNPVGSIPPEDIEEEGNATYTRLADTARTHAAYIVAPLLLRRGGKIFNASVVFDRAGVPVFVYCKTHPTPGEIDRGICPGPREPDVLDSDFGRIGIAICYDLNFQHLFRHYYDGHVELLLFSSYFPGGLLLRSWCFLYGFFAVTSHAQGDESVFVNNLGNVEAQANMFTQALTHTFEFDCVVAPYWGNHEQLRAAKEVYGPDLNLDIHRAEGDVIISYLGTGKTARDIVQEFGVRTRADYYDNDHLL